MLGRFPLDEIPFIPAKVDIADVINTGGRLIAQEDVASVKAAIKFLKQGLDGRYSKKDLETKFSITKIDGQYYAIYKGAKHNKHLGKGGFGTVKLVQNIDDGSWAAIKTIVNSDGKSSKSAVAREISQLQRVNHFLGNVETRVSKSKNAEQDIIIMKLAPGVPVNIFIKDKNRMMAPVKWLDFALGICRSISEIHALGILHRDIKPENILFDAASGTVTIIDYGIARKFTLDNEYYSGRGAGTSGYTAPEIRKPEEPNFLLFEKSPRAGYTELVAYDEATEVYALGITLVKLFGFAEKDGNVELDLNVMKRITNPQHREQIRALLTSMIHADRDQRPTMARVLEALTTLREAEIDLLSKVNILACINVNDFMHASAFQRGETLKAAQAADEVMLCFVPSQESRIESMRLKHELEGMGICVLQKAVLFDNNDKETITHYLKETIKKLSMDKDIIYRARYVSSLSFEEGATYTHVTPRNLDHVVITNDHLIIAADKIGKQIARMSRKNGDDTRLPYLQRFLEDLEHGKIKTYDHLFAALNQLENNMNARPAPSKLKAAASSLGLLSTTASKKVKKTAKVIELDAIGAQKLKRSGTL